MNPICLASWHVSVCDLDDPETLLRILRNLVPESRSLDVLTLADETPALAGGLALLSSGEVVVEPRCCSDLRNIAEWREAAGYRGSEWGMLWIGHPWLSIRYDGERLVLSEPHESDTPVARWLVSPDELRVAISVAEAKLERFARRLEALGVEEGRGAIAPWLAGLSS